MQRLLLSVAPLVKIISLAYAPITSAMYYLEFSQAYSVSHPYLCDFECGLPKLLVR
jgi:hypothetical protein